MTETTETPETPEVEAQGGNAEAAKYRRQLRDVEAERDAVREQLTVTRRGIVESMSGLKQPRALWIGDLDVNELLDADGKPDADKIKTTVQTVADELGLAPLPRTPRPDPSVGKGNGPATSRHTLRDAFRGVER